LFNPKFYRIGSMSNALLWMTAVWFLWQRRSTSRCDGGCHSDDEFPRHR